MTLGIGLSFLTAMLFAFFEVFFRYSAVVHDVHPTVFTCLTFFISSVMLITVSQSGKGGKETLGHWHTWAFGFFEILMNMAVVYALLYITATEMNFLARAKIFVALLISYFIFKRGISKYDVMGLVPITCALAYLVYELPREHLGAILFWMFIVTCSTAIRTGLADAHPESSKHLTVKQRCRVTGYVLMASSLLFLLFAVITSFFKAHMLLEHVVQIPFIAGAPVYADFFNQTTLKLAFIIGATVVPMAMFFYFLAIQLAKSEVFVMCTSTLPFFSYAFEYMADRMGIMDVSSVKGTELMAGVVMVIGSMVMVYGKYKAGQQLKVKVSSTATGKEGDKASQMRNEDYDVVCRTIKFCGGDILRAAKILSVPVAEVASIYSSNGAESFSAKGKAYKHIMHCYHRHVLEADSLTGLPMRAALEDALAQAYQEKIPFVVAFMDLNGFKPVNDTFGHEAGDKILQGVAERLQMNLEDCHFVSRLGGDEFVVLLKGVDKEKAIEIVHHLEEIISEPFVFDGIKEDIVIGASFGLAIAYEDGDTPEALLRTADARMYDKKNA